MSTGLTARSWYGLMGFTTFILAACGAGAHPMGNFSINHYARFTVEKGRLHLHYVLDMAEIPTVAEMRLLDANGDGMISDVEQTAYAVRVAAALRSKLTIQIEGQPVESALLEPTVDMRPGAGGLQTLRFSFSITAPLPRSNTVWNVVYADTNYAERTGWKEIVVTAGGGLTLAESNAPSKDISRELTAYPSDPTIAPPQQTEARFMLRSAQGRDLAPAVPETAALPPQNTTLSSSDISAPVSRTPRDAFTQSISRQRLTPSVVLVSLTLALLFGALHALSPGHGKAMVAAYLVGSRGTVRHAAFLGGVITLTHTISVYVLGLVTLAAAQFVVPERLYPLLSLGSGVAIVVVGVALLWTRIGEWREDRAEARSVVSEEDGGAPPLPENAEVSFKSLIVLGVTGGALPCPSALVVMLGAIALHRIAFGLALIGAFSLGLAAVLTGIGVLVVRLKAVLNRLPLQERYTARLPILSAALVTLVGVVLIVRALQGQY